MKTEKKLKILLLEDMPEDAQLIIRSLQKEGMDFEHERVYTEQGFRDGIRNFGPDVILSDHSLPQFNSMDALAICKSAGLSVPFILVTGAVSEEFAVSCIKQGVDDYILKSNLTRLPVAIAHAIEQKKLENAKKKSELALRKQNEILTKINKELDNFAYNVSHNLRAPLSSVIGLINIIKLEDQQNDNRFSELISRMDYSVRKLDMTLVNILNYSRNARLDSEYEAIDLKKLIEECLDDVQYMEGYGRIQKHIDVGNSIPFHTDKYRIKVIFHNLISNSIKYQDSEKQESFLNIAVKVDRESAEITFEDNGIGINKNLIKDIYKMFFRGTEKSDGAGLGLYIVKEMVDRLNGTIDISSDEHEGTRVSLIVPNSGIPVKQGENQAVNE